jgi:ribosomal protein L11 methyltransferase
VRTWPALEVGRLTRVAPDGPELLLAALVDYQVAAISESTPDVWQVFFDSAGERDRAAAALAGQFEGLSVSPIDVPDEDWVARSQAGLRAVRVGKIIVAPPWDVPEPNSLALDPAGDGDAQANTTPIVIVIRPSMGFGTAHHATTRLCLAALQRLDVRGWTVVDVGTGSGVLAIAASRLGAASVVGIDDDSDALQAAGENLTLNREATVSLHERDARASGLDGFDLVMANLTGALLVAAAVPLRGLVKSGGCLVLSGLLEEEESTVVAAYAGCLVHNRSQEGEWLCLSLLRA